MGRIHGQAAPALGQDHALRLPITEQGLWVGEHRGPEMVPLATRWSPAARRLPVTTAPFDQLPAHASLWDAGRPAPIGTLAGHAGKIRASAFSGNGKRLALADEEGVVSVYETADGRMLARRNVARLLDAVALDDQARRLAGADGQCHTLVWSTPNGKIERQLARPSVFGAQGARRDMLWDPEQGSAVAVLSVPEAPTAASSPSSTPSSSPSSAPPTAPLPTAPAHPGWRARNVQW